MPLDGFRITRTPPICHEHPSTNEKLGSTVESVLPAPVQLATAYRSHSRQNRSPHHISKSAKRLATAGFAKVLRKFNSDAPSVSSLEVELDSVTDANEQHATWWGSDSRARALEGAEEIDDVVVDREWGDNSRSHSISDASGEKNGGEYAIGAGASAVAEAGSEAGIAGHGGFWASSATLACVRWRIWPAIIGFFAIQFSDQKSESYYRKENWFLRKVCSFCLPKGATFGILTMCRGRLCGVRRSTS